MNFEKWMAEIDRIIGRRFGLSVLDLPDCPYMDWYDDGVSPKGAATRAMKSGGME